MQKGGAWSHSIGRFREPKIGPNRTQDESKLKTIFKSEKVALQEPLGSVLGRSWDVLEATLGSKFAFPYTRACVSSKITFSMLISFQDAFWTELGRTWPPQVPKMTPTWRPKTRQNRSKIDAKTYTKFGYVTASKT